VGNHVATLVDFPNSEKEEPSTGGVYAMPATPLQVRLWQLTQNSGPDPAWNVAVRFRLSGPPDRENLERSLQFLTTRHEALRTSLELHNGAVVERISSRAILPVEWCDLRGFAAQEQAEEVQHLSLIHAMQTLALDRAPLLRVRVLRLRDDEHLLLWNAHHTIFDGSSVGLLASDWMHCYGELRAGREPEPTNTLEYADYAVWLATQRRTPEYEAHRNYWKQQLRGLKAAELPRFWRNPDLGAPPPVIHSTLLPRALTDRLTAIAQNNQATFFHGVLAAFAVLMRSYQQSPEVVVGTPLSGRDQAELERIIGAFVNYLPLRLQVQSDTRYSELLHAARELVTDCFDHSQYRYEDMLGDAQNGEASVATESNLFSVALIVQQDFVRPIEAGGLALTAVPSVSPGALRPLTVFMVERADGWRLSCEVDNRTVSAAAGAALLEDFERLMIAVGDHPGELIAQLAARAGLTPIAETSLSNVDEAAIGAAAAAHVVEMGGQRHPQRIPATEAQMRFWMLDRLHPGDTSFDLTIRLEMNGRLSPDALRSAAEKLIERNEILRTTLEEQDDKVWQVIHPCCDLDFSFQLAGKDGPIPEPSQEQVAFSLNMGPLFRIRLVQLGEERHWLTITLSHAIADGWSSGAYLEQLGQAYQECLSGMVDESRKAPAQFSMYAANERSLLAGPEKNRRLAWWEKHLEGTWLPLALPRDKAPGVDRGAAKESAQAALESVALASGAVLSARRLARECNSTLFAIFGAAFQTLLARYSGQGDVLVLSPFANRTEETEDILGPLAIPVCITAHIAPETTFRELVANLSALSMDATENVLPFSLVAPLLDLRVVNGHHALNQVSFFYQRAFVHDMRWGALEVKNLPQVPSASGSEWQLGVVERSEGITAEFLYDTALYSQQTMSLVSRHYVRLLSRAIMEPDTPISQLQIATPEELALQSSGQSLLPVTESILPNREILSPAAVVAANPVEPSQPLAGSRPEREMLRIWRQLFKTDTLNSDSNFFDLGGHSLLLARLQILVKKTFNVTLTIADVFRYPTLATLTGWLERTLAIEAVSQPFSQNPRVIPIQPLGNGRPVFVISQSMIFRTLAAELGLEQPMYALQMLDEDVALVEGPDSFEQLAAFYVRLIRDVQPRGPYRLAGWCVSGWIAYAVARQFEAQGEEIQLLMVMDAWAPGYWRKQPRIRRLLMQSVYRGQRFRWIARRLRGCTMAQRNAYVRGSLHGMAAAVGKNMTAWLHRRLHLPLQVRLTEEMRLSEQLEYTASRSYEPGLLRGSVLLFRSDEQPLGPLLAPDMGWSDVIGRPAEVQVLPGDHQQIFELPGARMMAAAASKVLGIAPSPSQLSESSGDPQQSRRETHSIPMVEA
jgi:thioesterase domain-containing protein/non-ribosomal peptide synthetase component F